MNQTEVRESQGIIATYLRIAVASIVLLCLLALPIQAQVLYGTLTGNVTDPNGAVVAGAQVEARNVNTGTVQQATTDSSGIYRFSAILPGTYSVTISAGGFAKQVNESVSVSVNTVRRLDVALTLAKVSETVTVTGEAPVLQTDKTDVHTDLTATQITNLPITSSVGGRNFQSLLRVVPGFGNMTEQNSAAANPQRAMSTNVNGQSLQGINTRIDGAQDAYPWLPGNVAYIPPADAIETVNVVTNSFDAEQGMAGGAAVNVQVKSGTNTLHGEGFEFFNDQNLRTRNFFQTDHSLIANAATPDPSGTTDCVARPEFCKQRFPVHKPKNIKHQFGGTIGGPIIKDKLFFFGDYQRTTQRSIGNPLLTLPTMPMRTGDFSAFIPAGHDCNTARVANCIFDPTTNLAFPGNIIPTDRIDPAASKLVAILPPVGEGAPSTNNYIVGATGQIKVDNFDVKVNYVPSQKSTFFTRYSMSRSHIFDPPTLGAAGGDATNGGQLGNGNSRIQSVGLGATYSFSPSLLADWNFGFTRQRLGATALDIGSAFGSETLGIVGTNGFGTNGDPSLYNGIPAFQVSGVANIGNPNTGNPFLFRDNQFVSGANLSWMKGKHAWRFGIEYNHTQMNHFQPQGADGNFTTARGSFNFNGNLTASGTAQNPVNSFAQLLLGLPNRAGKAILLNNPVALRWTQWAWYARDQWQVDPRLTLTLGVRYEFYPFGYSDHGRGLAVFNPATGNVLIGGVNGIPLNSGVDAGHGQFLPRVGLAYRLGQKTVIRGGYGISADPSNYHFLRNAYPSTITSDPVGGSATTPAEISLTGTNAVGLLAALPVGLAPILAPLPDISSGTIPLPNGVGTRTFVNDFSRGYIHSFNFTVQQEIAGFNLEAGYVGNRGIRPLSNVNLNSSQICPASVQGPWASTTAKTRSFHCQGMDDLGHPVDGAPTYLRILNVNGHNWSGISAMMPFKNNYYDSLQAKVNRRLAGGSQVGLAYTFSKAINYTENEDLSGLFEHFPAYWEKNRALASFDRPHNLQVYAVYDLPFGHGKRWAQSGVGNAIAGGWQLNTVISRLSGTPYSVTANAAFLNPTVQDGLNNTSDRVAAFHKLNGKPWTLNGSCPISNLSCHYFDPASFAQPQQGVFGNTGRNQFRGPGIFGADLSLFRNFKLTERFTFQFRAEAFGLTNTPRFNNPNSGCGSANPGDLCSTAASNNNFGTITGTNGTSGSNSSTDGTRTIWFAGKLMF